MEDYLPASDQLINSGQLTVNIKAKDASMYGFIDDIITITIDNTYWVERAKNSALLVIYTIFRPLHSNKPLKRNDPFSLRKLAGEGKISERKTCMGWDIHTHSLNVFLPKEKDTYWDTTSDHTYL